MEGGHMWTYSQGEVQTMLMPGSKMPIDMQQMITRRSVGKFECCHPGQTAFCNVLQALMQSKQHFVLPLELMQKLQCLYPRLEMAIVEQHRDGVSVQDSCRTCL